MVIYIKPNSADLVIGTRSGDGSLPKIAFWRSKRKKSIARLHPTRAE
jgi:hypothetical protein